jgi:hypothetical protein
MRGRNTPSPELEIAASYLVNQYKLWGLQPGGENGTFYQWWPFRGRGAAANSAGVPVPNVVAVLPGAIRRCATSTWCSLRTWTTWGWDGR